MCAHIVVVCVVGGNPYEHEDLIVVFQHGYEGLLSSRVLRVVNQHCGCVHRVVVCSQIVAVCVVGGWGALFSSRDMELSIRKVVVFWSHSGCLCCWRGGVLLCFPVEI